MTRRRTGQSPIVQQTVSSPPDELPNRIYSTAFGIAIHPKRDGAESASSSVSSSPHGTADAGASSKKKILYTIVKAELLIPGDGAPLEDGGLVIENDLIAWVGPARAVPSKYTTASHRAFAVPVLMPGLWDVHAHFGGEPPDTTPTDVGALFLEHPATSGARLTRGCWEALQRGYTSLRDVAGYGCELARAIDDGSVAGPHVYSVGACLSQTAGHGDIFALPAGDVHRSFGLAGGATPGHWGSTQTLLVDGVDECRRAVRLQIRRGARAIKIFASGGVLSLDDDPLCAQFSPEELAVIVSEAARQRRLVAAHVHGKPGILAAVRAGVATVEHVSFADEECVALIKERGTIYVATRTIVDMLLRSGGKGLSKYQWEKAQLCGSNHLKAYKMAIEAGVPVALGTDTAPGFNMAMELEHAVLAGLSPLEAIKAATANGPLTVGEMAPKTGQLKAGYEADILGVLYNPVEDVKILQNKENIGWVWKSGRLFKGPGVGPWGEDPL
ncbi:amidohydrolase [Hypoxylon argillaceum]|nr:amidohydrolase [Hypoxylon argillaceum]